MQIKKSIHIRALALAVVVLITSIWLPSVALANNSYQSQLDDINAQMRRLDDQRRQIESNIAGARDERAQETLRRNSINEEITITRGEISLLSQRITLLEEDIEAQLEAIEEKQEEIEANHALFLARTRAQFVQDDASTLGLVLGADSFVSFLTRTDSMVRIADRDRRLTETLTEQRIELEEAKEALEARLEELEDDRALINDRQRSLNSQVEAANQRIGQLDAREQEFQRNLESNRAMREQMQREMDEIFRRIEMSQNPYVGGDMAWPVPGHFRVTSEFGLRFGGRDNHTGIDIAGASQGVINGATVVAANSGTVRVANHSHSPGRGYGMFIIIDHGGGVSTLYAHLSAISVTVGQNVNIGDPIGRVGSTGWSTGPHLHFEVRHNGRAVNPRPYIFRR
ncbi:MAG: peptidoglycan DD-metalloendopeptidase family protein [Oscillospiraceae bacterium]|nr:peptidoglycan DD-metalloendopeptidase family protein [Oscillospiraceae bacterium]